MGDEPVKLGVLCLVDNTHPAAVKLAHEPSSRTELRWMLVLSNQVVSPFVR